MKQIGFVVEDNGDYVKVSSMRESSCGTSCENCSAKCGESKIHNQKVLNTIGAKVGDKVILETSFKTLISYIGLVYGLPLLFFIIGVIVSSNFLGFNTNNAQLLNLLVGLLFMIFSFIIIKIIDSKYIKNKDFIVLKKA
ncbi:MAG: SoxR reducing system RseC family protein [Peptoniphilaceae bacterium]